ncbi:UNVERIFIED_CONTAM: ABC-2 type transport system permease protein [Brevibacillus sp. OAP136]
MKLDVEALFHERFRRFSVEFVRYSQYLANGGVLFFTIILGGILAFYYRSFVELIPPWLPIPYVLALLLAVFTARCPHRTFLLEADLLFLTPLETDMSRYFQKTKRYNFFVQSVWLCVLLLICSPMYTGTMSVGQTQLVFYWCVPLVLKGWNVYSSWIVLRLPDKRDQRLLTLARFVYTYYVIAWTLGEGQLFAYQHIPFGGLLCIVPLFWFHVRLQRIRTRHSLKWYALLEMENGLKNRFYRIVNQFTDIPALQHRVKPRRWLDWVTRLIPYRQSNAARVLFFKTFIRSGDYAGVYVRLVLLGALLVMILPNPYVKIIVAVLFLLIARSQLAGIRKHLQASGRLALFPINETERKRSFQWGCRLLLLLQAVVSIIAALL